MLNAQAIAGQSLDAQVALNWLKNLEEPINIC